MSDFNELEEKLPPTTGEFIIDIIGQVTKKRFLGEFVSKIPTIKDQSMIARHEAKLNGEYAGYLDEGIRQVHKKIAYLRFTLTDYPKFWRESDLGYDLMDVNVIDAVYAEVIDYENKWVNKIWQSGQEKEVKKDESGKAGQEEG